MANHPLLIGATPGRQNHKVWRFRHDDAVRNPRTGGETTIVALAAAIAAAADMLDGPDAVGTPAIGDLLAGFRTLLNFDIGRLDAGTCESFAWAIARRVGWDLDTEAINWAVA